MIDISDKLQDKLLTIPDKPGIYKMLDREKNIIYIGKSISLRKRVRTYFSKKQMWKKARKFARLIDDIEYIVTDTHLEARILECELIKKLRPAFNSQFKNDRGYVYINVNDYNIHTPTSIVYQYEAGVFGPFRGRFFVLKILDSLKNLYPIYKENETYNFTYKVLPIQMDRDSYNKNKDSLIDIFSNDDNFILFIKALEDEMKKASDALHFETAMTFRDLLRGLNYLKGSLKEDQNLFLRKLFVNIPIESGNKFFFISRGKILIKKSFKTYNTEDMNSFIKNARELKVYKENPFEKSSLDFRDIIYSEIRNLPKEMVHIIS